jgi:hypothetical protein
MSAAELAAVLAATGLVALRGRRRGPAAPAAPARTAETGGR